MAREGSSCLQQALKIAGLVLLIYFLVTINLRSLGLPFGEWPRLPLYVYTTSKVTLTFDGEEIAIEGTTRCKRRFEMDEDGDIRWLMFLDHIGFAYKCGPEWFGHRFEDGSALLVGAASDAGPWHSAWRALLSEQPNLAHFDPAFRSEQISRVPPAVIWLDDAEAPARAEYYYSMAALEDPRSRLTAMRHEADMWAASWWTSFFTGRAVTGHLAEVPWIIPPSASGLFVGYHVVELPKERWDPIPGLRQQLDQLSKPTIIYPGPFLSHDQRVALSETLAGRPGIFPPREIQGPARAPLYDALGSRLPKGTLTGTPELEVRVRPVEADQDVFRIDDSLPVGALRLHRRKQSYLIGSTEFRLGDGALLAPNTELWSSGFIFDPAADAIYRPGHVTF